MAGTTRGSRFGSETATQAPFSGVHAQDGIAVPGAVVISSSGEPLQGAFAVDREPLEIGRGKLRRMELRDTFMSRRHTVIAFDAGEWVITDCGSRNGTAVDGDAVTGTVRSRDFRLVRAGETLFLLCPDITPFQQHHIELKEKAIIGPRSKLLFEKLRRAAATGNVHVTGETGAGKEIAARAFHDLGPYARGPYVAVNCAAIPEGVAERLLFGAKKGAFSGASADAGGYVQAADGGTLFLDEVFELDLSVQAKLLRVLECGEVLALGSSRPQSVELRVVSATHKDLRQAVASRSFREDLYFRLGRPTVELLPLRERPEEIPYFIDLELRKLSTDLRAHASLVEACLLRPWPGNVRELLLEIRAAGNAALDAGSCVVRISHLSPSAGTPHPCAEPAIQESPETGKVAKAAAMPLEEEIRSALVESEGRVATAARALGLHRNQLRRWLEKRGIDPVEWITSEK